MTKAGKRILEGAREALGIARGDKKPARIFVPAEIDVKAVRLRCDLSQEDFAAQFGFTIDQIKAWEQQRTRPIGGVRTYLMLIDRDPQQVMKLVREARATKKAARVAA